MPVVASPSHSKKWDSALTARVRFCQTGTSSTAATALLVGIFIYKAITWDNCMGAFVRAFRTSATVFIIIAAAGPFSWLLTSLGAIKDLEVWLLGYADNPLLFAFVMVTFIYALGMVMDAAANIIVVGECPADC